MKKITSRFLNYTLALFILFVCSCTTEEAALTQTLDAEKWFNENVTKDDFLLLNYVDKIDWKNAIETNGSEGEATEIPLLLEDNIGSSEKNKSYEFYRIMIVKSSSGLFKSYFIQINTQDNTFINIDPDFNFYTIDENFNGSIMIKELKSKKISSINFKNGQKNRPSVTARIDVYCLEYGLIYDGGFDSYYTLGCWTGGGGSSQPIEYPVDQPNPSGGGSGGGGNNNNGNCGPDYRWRLGKCEPIYKVIDNLTGKAKCVYDKLKNSSTGFDNAIKKFDGDFSVSHLKLTINNSLETNVYGETLPPVNYITEVQISNNALGTLSDLGKATVFAHEIIHAEIFRKMLSAAQNSTLETNGMSQQQQVNYVNSLRNNFPGLYDYYYKRYKPTWNHELMANHYRSIIADVAQQFDNNRLPRSTYEAVAWVGLGVLDKEKGLTTIAWDNLSSDQKTIINNLIRDNFYNGPSNCN